MDVIYLKKHFFFCARTYLLIHFLMPRSFVYFSRWVFKYSWSNIILYLSYSLIHICRNGLLWKCLLSISFSFIVPGTTCKMVPPLSIGLLTRVQYLYLRVGICTDTFYNCLNSKYLLYGISISYLKTRFFFLPWCLS